MRELQRLGVPAEQLAAERAARGSQQPPPADDGAPVVAAHLMPAVRVFAAMRTQWDLLWTPEGPRRCGLRYDRVQAVARGLGLGRRAARRLLPALQVMENEELKLDGGAA